MLENSAAADFDPLELKRLVRRADERTAAAARDAIAVTMAAIIGQPHLAVSILSEWVGPAAVPGSYPHMIANALIDLTAGHLRSASSVSDGLTQFLTREDATRSDLQSLAARAVAARTSGNDGPVALIFSHHLAPERAQEDVVRFLVALAAVSGAIVSGAARVLSTTAAQLLRSSGAAVA